MNYKFLILVAFLCLSLISNSQKVLQKAEVSYSSQNYSSGVDNIKLAYDKMGKKGAKAKKERAGLAYKVAECYRLTELFKDANEWYEKAILLDHFQTEPLVYYYNAEMLRIMGETDKAIKNYTLYKEQIKETNPNDKKADIGISSCKSFKDMKSEKTLHVIENQTSLNKGGTDMAPMIGDPKNTKMYYSSSRTGVKGLDIDPRSGEVYMDLWFSTIDAKGHFGEPQLVKGLDINTEDSEGTVCFDGKFKTMFFTRCPNEKKKNLGCEIWMSEAKDKNEWLAPKKILLTQNDTITVGHPCVSEDGKFLIFVSDLPGGYGGRDLWYTTFDKKTETWSVPVNMGPELNTAGNEMFPTFAKSGNLYFASDGIVGLGGLDIFVATKLKDQYKWENPKNMGYPINSENNDYSLVELTDKKGFYTSERKNTNGGNEFDADIYSYDLPPNLFDVKIIVSEVGQKQNKIADVKVIIKGADAANSWEGYTKKDGSIMWDKRPNGDRYVLENMAYTIAISKEGFHEDKKGAKFTTVGLTNSQSFVVELALLPIVVKPIRLPEVRYPLGQWTLLVDSTINSKDSLNYVYDLLNEYPGLVLELSSHTDARGTDEANQLLSENRAKECVKYLVTEKGIDARRLIPVGKGEREPAFWTDPATGEKIQLTEAYINQFKKTDKIKFDKLHQLNRRTEGKILNMDFDPETATPLVTPPVAPIK
jgi:outer membrane protein OmpA-like peptidoglycan-associated protein/tetratricopeptide (TPR) repeat protein